MKLFETKTFLLAGLLGFILPTVTLASPAVLDKVKVSRRKAGPVIDEDVLTKVWLMQDVLAGLEKVVKFFAEDYSSINVDGVFGIRLMQGSLDGVIKECMTDQLDCPKDLIERLGQIEKMLTKTGEMALPYLQAQDPEYFDKFSGVISDKYDFDYRPEVLGEGTLVPHHDDVYSEATGDVCMSLILGTGQIRGQHMPKCTITPSCWELTTRPDMDSYFITHQLIYKILLQKKGCERQVADISKDDNPDLLRSQQRDACRNILGESRVLAQDGQVAMEKQDLFLEQVVLCGMLGFQDFLNADWMRLVLSWQTAHGCYSMTPRLLEDSMRLEQQQRDRERLVEALRKEADAIEQSPPVPGRKLLREIVLPGSCLAHKTGLAAGCLGVFLRTLVEQIYTI